MWGGSADDRDSTCAGCGGSMAITDRMKDRLKGIRSADVAGFKSALHALGWRGANALTLPGRITVGVCDRCLAKLESQMRKGKR